MDILKLGIVAVMAAAANGFTLLPTQNGIITTKYSGAVYLSASGAPVTTGGFIETELRGQAMKLHTRSQAPKEGEAPERESEPYVPVHSDYLSFLVDSQHIYRALEEVVNEVDELAVFRNTGLERVSALENDIEFMIKEYNLEKPAVGKPGLDYADEIRRLGNDKKIPEFICHFYNFYFAHTAGGRMIGKQMSALLLEKKTLDFYKWAGDLNEIKNKVKDDIEEMVSHWSREEKDACVNETAGAFRAGSMVNSYLSGDKSAY
eukprot:scaffold3084_cov144-Cylindrotheca_fusiformis.AAC.77